MADPDTVRVDTSQLYWDIATVTVPEVPTVPAGGDPMSLLVSHIMPTIASDVTAKIAATKAREDKLAANLYIAKQRYQSTDDNARQAVQAAESSIANSSEVNPVSSATTSSAASDSGMLGQFMGMVMPGAQQAAQTPPQMASTAGQVPQTVMQSVQGMVQVGQSSGVGNGDKAPDAGQNGAGAPTGAAGSRSGDDQKDAYDKQDANTGQSSDTQSEKPDYPGASGGQHQERAPLPPQSGPPTAPGRHRPSTNPEIDL